MHETKKQNRNTLLPISLCIVYISFLPDHGYFSAIYCDVHSCVPDTYCSSLFIGDLGTNT